MVKQWTSDEVRAAVGHFRNLTSQERKALPYRSIWYDYTFARWRCNGKPQVWVTRPDEVSVPSKHGLRTFNRFDEQDTMLTGPWELASGLREQVLSNGQQAGQIRRAVAARFGSYPFRQARV